MFILLQNLGCQFWTPTKTAVRSASALRPKRFLLLCEH